MQRLLFWILTLSIIAGQLIKIPLGSGGLSLLDLTIIIACLTGLYQIKFKLKNPPIFLKAAGVFVFIGTVSLFFSPLHLTAAQMLSSFFYTIRFSLYILFGWLLSSGAFPYLRNNIGKVLINSGVGLAILGLLQFIFLPDLRFLTPFGWDPHYFRTVSTFLDPNFAGAYFVLTLLLLRTRQKWMLVIFLALLTTFSRSSYLMFLISGSTLAFLEKSKTLFLKILIAFIILMAGFWVYTQLISKPHNIDRDQSASYRLDTWQQGFNLFQKSPFLGIGYNAYRFGIEKYQLGPEQFIQSHGSSSNDSSLLFVLTTTGIVGLISYLYFLFCLVKSDWKNNLIITSAIAGLLIHSFFADSLFYPPILAWIILISATPKK